MLVAFRVEGLGFGSKVFSPPNPTPEAPNPSPSGESAGCVGGGGWGMRFHEFGVHGLGVRVEGLRFRV